MMNIDQLIELDRLAKNSGQGYQKKRALFEEIVAEKGDHYIGIIGPRGAGKTIILKQIALNEKRSFYISLDTLEGDLFEIIKRLHETLQIKIFLLDEVHIYPNIEAVIKKAYDTLKIKIIFTSSMALAMYESGYDLSRRVVLKTLYPFSLREYAYFKNGLEFPSLTVKDLIGGSIVPELVRAGELFLSYMQGGLMPFALTEPQPLTLLANILQTIIRKDIPRVGRLLTDELDKIEQVVRFIGRSEIDGINYSSVANNLKITRYKAQQYINLLERAFILHQVFPQGSNVLKEPKVVMALPYRLLYRPMEEAIGGLREDFFVETFKAIGRKIFYLKSTRGQKTPDYLLEDQEDLVFEIGGKGKGRSQFKGLGSCRKLILADGYDTNGLRRPLFLVGFLK